MDFRREFREIEATDFQNDAVKAMDSKTLLRLINRLQNGVQNVKGEEDEPPYGRWYGLASYNKVSDMFLG